MGKITGFMEFERRDRPYAPVPERIRFFKEFVRALPGKPVLIGHSMGGLVVQLLLQQGIAAGGVAIDSAPPAGVFSAQWSFVKANFPMINPFISGGKPRLMP